MLPFIVGKNEITSGQVEFAMIRVWTLVLYGTIIPPQKDDLPRQSPPHLLYNNYSINTFYRPNINSYGTTSVYANRKQQAPQKSSTTMPATTPRKNGKQKNGKGNKNGNQRTSTTQRPVYTTLNQFTNSKPAKNKLKFSTSASSQNSNRITSTMRPRTSTKPPTANTKSHLDGGSKNNNNNLLSPKADKVQPANSNIYEKAPGKAPKQVKEGSYSTPTTTSSPMSKMFERYEKIEQIYPELKPYKDNSPTYFTVNNGNGKPSRENSKSFSSFVSMNSMLQKKNSPGEISTVERQQVDEKNGKGERGKGHETGNQFIFSPQLLVAFSSFFVFLIFCLLSVFLRAWGESLSRQFLLASNTSLLIYIDEICSSRPPRRICSFSLRPPVTKEFCCRFAIRISISLADCFMLHSRAHSASYVSRLRCDAREGKSFNNVVQMSDLFPSLCRFVAFLGALWHYHILLTICVLFVSKHINS